MIINRKELEKLTGYDFYQGNAIHKPFAYRVFREDTHPIGNIVCFRAPMKVETDGMIDLEDLLTDDFIYSEDAINIIWEIPNLCPFGATSFQRLFNTQIANILYQIIKTPIEVDGDDLMINDKFVGSDGLEHDKGKCSVSITYSKNNIALGHTAINVNAGNEAPGFAYSTKMNDEQCKLFMQAVIDCFFNMIQSINLSTRKITID